MHYILPKRNIRSSLVRGLISEFIGTLFLSATIAVVINIPTTNSPALTIGMMLLTQVFAYGYIGGGMFNPAVTTGVYMTMYRRAAVAGDPQGRKHFMKWIVTLAVQFVGALAGANLSAGIIGPNGRDNFGAPMAAPGVSLRRSFAAELLFTCSLVSVMLNTAMARRYESSPNSFYGIGIGMSVFVGVSCVANISGAAFNPAVATALQLSRYWYTNNSDALSQWYIYWAAGICAGIGAALVFTLISDDETEDIVEETKAAAHEDDHTLVSKGPTPRASLLPGHHEARQSARQSAAGGDSGRDAAKGYFQQQADKAEAKRLKRKQEKDHEYHQSYRSADAVNVPVREEPVI
jgi:aquaporin Z